MIKKIFAAFAVFIMVVGLCACKEEKSPASTADTSLETTQNTEAPTDTTAQQEENAPEKMENRWLTYEEYKALTPEQQQAYYESFATPEEYMIWFKAVTRDESTDNDVVVDDNEAQVTQPTKTEDEEQPEKKQPVWLTYEEYMALSPEKQQAYYESFPTPQDYMEWYNAVAKEHKQDQEDDTKVDPPDSNVQPTQPTETGKKPEQPTTEDVTEPPTEESTDFDHLVGSGSIVTDRPPRA